LARRSNANGLPPLLSVIKLRVMTFVRAGR
jgi:hypothetical protein